MTNHQFTHHQERLRIVSEIIEGFNPDDHRHPELMLDGLRSERDQHARALADLALRAADTGDEGQTPGQAEKTDELAHLQDKIKAIIDRLAEIAKGPWSAETEDETKRLKTDRDALAAEFAAKKQQIPQ